MRRISAAGLDEAVGALATILGSAGGWLPVTRAPGGLWWHRCGPMSGGVLARAVRRFDEQGDVELRFGLPHARRFNGGTSWSTVLWAVVEGKDQLRRAVAFRPLPTLVLREGSGSRRTLLWALDRRAGWQETLDANRRLAYRLGAVQKLADPDALALPVPGTFLRVGRSRPAPVVVSRLVVDSFRAADVVRGLKEPPDPLAWRERRSEGSR